MAMKAITAVLVAHARLLIVQYHLKSTRLS
jgi:hypothetical protein